MASAIDPPLGAWRVSLPLQRDLGGGVLDLAEIVGRQLDIRRAEILLQAVQLRRPGNRHDPRLSGCGGWFARPPPRDRSASPCLADQLLHRPGDILDRHIRVDAVLVEKVDVFRLKSLQASPAPRMSLINSWRSAAGRSRSSCPCSRARWPTPVDCSVPGVRFFIVSPSPGGNQSPNDVGRRKRPTSSSCYPPCVPLLR